MELLKNLLSTTKAKSTGLDDCIIDGNNITVTNEEIVNEWDVKIRRKISGKLTVCKNEKVFEDVIKDYIRVLKEQARNFKEKKTLKEKILRHLRVFHLLCNSTRDQIDTYMINYLDYIENILIILCNLELEVIRNMKKNSLGKDYQTVVEQVAQRMIDNLSIHLMNDEKRIFHVLLKLDHKHDPQMRKDVMHIVYRHYLIHVPPKDRSDLSFCRNYLLFEKWKSIIDKNQHKCMNKIIYFRFRKSLDYLSHNKMLRSILLPSTETIVDLVDILTDGQQAAVNAYFRFVDSKSGDDELLLPQAIDLDSEDEDDITSVSLFGPSENGKRHNRRIKTENNNNKQVSERYVEVPSTNGDVVCVIDDDDSDVEEVSVSITNKSVVRRKPIQKPPYTRPAVSFLDSIILSDELIARSFKIPPTDKRALPTPPVEIPGPSALPLVNVASINHAQRKDCVMETEDIEDTALVNIESLQISETTVETNMQISETTDAANSSNVEVQDLVQSGTTVVQSGATTNQSGTTTNQSLTTTNQSGTATNENGVVDKPDSVLSVTTINQSVTTSNQSGTSSNQSGTVTNESGVVDKPDSLLCVTTTNQSGTTSNQSGTISNQSGTVTNESGVVDKPDSLLCVTTTNQSGTATNGSGVVDKPDSVPSVTTTNQNVSTTNQSPATTNQIGTTTNQIGTTTNQSPTITNQSGNTTNESNVSEDNNSKVVNGTHKVPQSQMNVDAEPPRASTKICKCSCGHSKVCSAESSEMETETTKPNNNNVVKPTLKTVEIQTDNITESFNYLCGMITPPSDRTTEENSPASMDTIDNNNINNTNIYAYIPRAESGLHTPYESDVENSAVCEISTQVCFEIQNLTEKGGIQQISAQLCSFESPAVQNIPDHSLMQTAQPENVYLNVCTASTELCNFEPVVDDVSSQIEDSSKEYPVERSDAGIRERATSVEESLEDFIVLRGTEKSQHRSSNPVVNWDCISDAEFSDTELDHPDTEIDFSAIRQEYRETVIEHLEAAVEYMEPELDTEPEEDIDVGTEDLALTHITDYEQREVQFEETEAEFEHTITEFAQTAKQIEHTETIGHRAIEMAHSQIVIKQPQYRQLRTEHVHLNAARIANSALTESNFDSFQQTNLHELEQYRKIVVGHTRPGLIEDYTINEKTYTDVNTIPIRSAEACNINIDESQRNLIVNDGKMYSNDRPLYISNKDFVVVPNKDDLASNKYAVYKRTDLGDDMFLKDYEEVSGAKPKAEKTHKIQASVTMSQLVDKPNLRQSRRRNGEHTSHKTRKNKVIFTSTESVPLSVFSKFEQQAQLVENAFSGPIEPLNYKQVMPCENSNDSFCIFDSDNTLPSKERDKSVSNSPTGSPISPPYENIQAKEFESHVLTLPGIHEDFTKLNKSEKPVRGVMKRKHHDSSTNKKLKVNFGQTEVKIIPRVDTRLVSDRSLETARESMEEYKVDINDRQLVYMEPRTVVKRDSISQKKKQLLINKALGATRRLQQKEREREKEKEKQKEKDKEKEKEKGKMPVIQTRVDYEKPREEIDAMENYGFVHPHERMSSAFLLPSGYVPALCSAKPGFKRNSQHSKGQEEKCIIDLHLAGKRKRKRREPVVVQPMKPQNTKAVLEPTLQMPQKRPRGRPKKAETLSYFGISYTNRPFRVE